MAFALLDIFTLTGAPAVLQTDNGREFEGAAGKSCHFTAGDSSEIITEIRCLWPECKIIHGRPCHFESQGGVERLNRTYEQKILVWLEENQSLNWSVGCKLARWQINTQFHTGVKNVPYILEFGQRPRCGISSLPLSPELMCALATEAQLNAALNLPEDGHIEDSYFSWTSDHQIIDTTHSVEDYSNVCEDNLIVQIPTSLLKSTNFEEISQPSPIDDNLSDENSSIVNENSIRDTTSLEVRIHEPSTTNTSNARATYVNTSLDLSHNDQVESPNRRELRIRAAESLIIQGEHMKKCARRSDGIVELPIGTILKFQ